MTDCWHQDPSARPTARSVASALEMFSPMKDRQNAAPSSYLAIPAATEGSRRRSIEDLRSEASSPRFVCKETIILLSDLSSY